ncbi:MAG: hypothetical protein ACLPZR_01145 [Solirubrobacteraceae bacterium]
MAVAKVTAGRRADRRAQRKLGSSGARKHDHRGHEAKLRGVTVTAAASPPLACSRMTHSPCDSVRPTRESGSAASMMPPALAAWRIQSCGLSGGLAGPTWSS